MRQPLKAGDFSTAFTTKLPVSLLIKLKEQAQVRSTTASALVRKAIEATLED